MTDFIKGATNERRYSLHSYVCNRISYSSAGDYEFCSKTKNRVNKIDDSNDFKKLTRRENESNLGG